LRLARTKSQSACSLRSIRIMPRLLSSGYEASLGAGSPE
jgi:hypothetical protein